MAEAYLPDRLRGVFAFNLSGNDLLASLAWRDHDVEKA